MRLIVFFLVLSIHVSAQDLKYIPDVNLRNALTEQGFTTNDSLDLSKIRWTGKLNLDGKGIVNLDGLQYFKRVSSLSLYSNEIESLDYLPPNLNTLSCVNNKIKEIENLPKKLKRISCGANNIKEIRKLPPKLEWLSCGNNEINVIENLPPHLKHLNFRSNEMTYIPELPANIEFINYANNPIPFDSLAPEYQDFKCKNKDIDKNCLPYKFVKWNILSSDMVKLPQDIKRMTIEVGLWSQESKTEMFDFAVEGSNFVADKVKVTKKYYDSIDVTYIHNKYSVDIDKVQDVLNDIYAEKMSFTIPRQHDTIKVDLSEKKVFCPSCRCGRTHHDSGYGFHYIFYTDTDKFEFRSNFFSFNSSINGLIPCGYTTHGNIKRALNWFYMYKLANLTLKNHEATKIFLNEENLEHSVKVVEKKY